VKVDVTNTVTVDITHSDTGVVDIANIVTVDITHNDSHGMTVDITQSKLTLHINIGH